IVGQNGRLTLTRLIANGSLVKEGDVIAEFDPTQQLDAAFTARAKYEDLGHQVDQKVSQNRADAEKRRGDLTQAEADFRKAPLAGMVAHQNVYRGNTNGHAQEGDQLWNGQAVVNIFDPAEMQVRCLVGEPDGAALAAGARVRVFFDAYPDLSLPGHFEFASPM